MSNSQQGKRILVLGGAGFIGTNLVSRLVANGAAVKVFTRASRSVRNLSPVLSKIELIHGDYMDEVAIRKAVKHVDCIIHLISTTFPGTSIDSSVYDVYSNLIPTIRLIESCTDTDVQKIVYASSGGTIYGEPRTIPITEDHLLDPKSMYGLSKKTLEGYLTFFARNSTINIQTLRLSNPFGPYQNPYGAQGLIAVALRAALDGSTLRVFGKGETVRDYIYIDDVISAFLAALDTPSSEIINVSSGTGKSVMEVISAVEAISRRDIKKEFIPQRVSDVDVNILSNSKAKQRYNWEPSWGFNEGLEQTWSWILREFNGK